MGIKFHLSRLYMKFPLNTFIHRRSRYDVGHSRTWSCKLLGNLNTSHARLSSGSQQNPDLDLPQPSSLNIAILSLYSFHNSSATSFEYYTHTHTRLYEEDHTSFARFTWTTLKMYTLPVGLGPHSGEYEDVFWHVVYQTYIPDKGGSKQL